MGFCNAKAFTHEPRDNLAGHNSFIQGKSSANQRIESYWSKLRQGGGGWWMDFFKDLRDSGIFKDHDLLHRECLRFCFMNVLQKEQHDVKAIQVKSNSGLHGGKPDVMYFLPKVYNKTNYLVPVNQDDVTICPSLFSGVWRSCKPYPFRCCYSGNNRWRHCFISTNNSINRWVIIEP